jgi:hypothetical protein
MTDGRADCVLKTVPVALEKLHGPIATKLIHDDSGDPEYTAMLWDVFGPHGFVIHSTGQRSGFGGAIRSAWAWLREHDRGEFIWHQEDDFLISETISLGDIADVLTARPDIAQMALLRQPWSQAERTAGGIIEQHPADYSRQTHGPHSFRTHRRFFTTNPGMYRRDLILKREWPAGINSEGMFSIELFGSDPGALSAFWDDRVACEHIGHQRVGVGY